MKNVIQNIMLYIALGLMLIMFVFGIYMLFDIYQREQVSETGIINWKDYIFQRVVLKKDNLQLTFIPYTEWEGVYFVLEQDGVGNRDVIFPENVKWLEMLGQEGRPKLTERAGARDSFCFMYVDGIWYGYAVKLDMEADYAN